MLLTALLVGCGSPQTLEQADSAYTQAHTESLLKLTHWQFSGKIRIRTEDSSDSANILWQQQGEQYRIVLSGPLGQVGAIIEGTPYQVTLEMPDHPLYRASTPEALMYEHFGWDLPLSHLFYWVRTLPAPGSDFRAKTNEDQHLAEIRQDGWEIYYDRFHQSYQPVLPGRMKISKGPLRLTLVMNEWRSDALHVKYQAALTAENHP